jgi:hypothetical protein
LSSIHSFSLSKKELSSTYLYGELQFNVYTVVTLTCSKWSYQVHNTNAEQCTGTYIEILQNQLEYKTPIMHVW